MTLAVPEVAHCLFASTDDPPLMYQRTGVYSNYHKFSPEGWDTGSGNKATQTMPEVVRLLLFPSIRPTNRTHKPYSSMIYKDVTIIIRLQTYIYLQA